MLGLALNNSKLPMTQHKIVKTIENSMCNLIESKLIKIGNEKYVVYLSIKDQLFEILTRKGINCIFSNIDKIFSYFFISGAYKKLVKEPHIHLHFSAFVDGVSPFKSGALSFWPIYVAIDELPYKERFHFSTIMLGNIYIYS